jgi:hypothetical protein
MENLTLFIIGFCIFATYIFFLLRMISRQHSIQKQTDDDLLNAENKSNPKGNP